ncbi:hypothetical protein GCM10011361_18780 [Muriicola marianensis]|uniref:PepSY domain-containing protein n=2 Tax=Muriicola marianensis TaxID=1324801 RepID=A0ABQ1R0R8_9FLAO|nr:hypothetical protein GCM10011361_18780 [Muriicola marianensis]
MKYSFFLTIASFLVSFHLCGQAKYEREFRITKSQFPEQALTWIAEELKDARRVRFYKEIDSARVSYEAKFKKDRLHYSVEFNAQGELEDIELLIEEVDIPREVYQAIENYITGECSRFKIRRLQQQYPMTMERNTEAVIRDAFQNLILPYINYELIVSCRKDTGRVEYEYLFNAEGSFISRRISLPPNYDHILY